MPPALTLWAGAVVGLLTGGIAWWVAGSALALAAGCLMFRRRVRHVALVAAVFLAVGAALGATEMVVAAGDPAFVAGQRGSWATVELVVRTDPQVVRSPFGAGSAERDGDPAPSLRWRVSGTFSLVQVAGRATTSSAEVALIGDGPTWSALIPGQRIRVQGLLSVDEFPVVPGVRLTARGAPVMLADAPWWHRIAADVRTDLIRSAAVLPPDPAGLLPGLVVGDTSGIDDRLDADAKTSGLAHLLAVSGSHFAILCGIAVVILRRAGPRVAVAGGATVLVGLVLLVGPEPSVLRAAVMGGIGLVAILAGRIRSAMPALAAAVILLLTIDPSLALSAGFTLSVLATGGLVLLVPPWSESLQKRGMPRGWSDLLVIPLAAQVATLPVIAALSGQVSLASVPANLLVAPVVAPALLLGVLSAVAGPWAPTAAEFLARADGPLLGWITGVAHTLAQQPSAAVPWPATTTGVLVLTGVLVVGLLLLRHRRIRAVVAALTVGALVVLVPAQVVRLPGWPVPGWLLAACEVGQGDAMVLPTDDPGSAVVVDSGPDPGPVAECLDRLGIGTIPLLVLTHLHSDHIDGLPGVLEGRSVGAIGVGPEREPAAAWRTIEATAARRGIPLVELPVGTRWSSGGLDLNVLGPQKLFDGTDSDPNNDSVVVMAHRGGERILMTGDVEIEAQQSLLNAGVDLHADILKVPHHGSAKDLPSFLAAISPQVAVIGVGRDNDYGHPSPPDAGRAAEGRSCNDSADRHRRRCAGLPDRRGAADGPARGRAAIVRRLPSGRGGMGTHWPD